MKVSGAQWLWEVCPGTASHPAPRSGVAHCHREAKATFLGSRAHCQSRVSGLCAGLHQAGAPGTSSSLPASACAGRWEENQRLSWELGGKVTGSQNCLGWKRCQRSESSQYPSTAEPTSEPSHTRGGQQKQGGASKSPLGSWIGFTPFSCLRRDSGAPGCSKSLSSLCRNRWWPSLHTPAPDLHQCVPSSPSCAMRPVGHVLKPSALPFSPHFCISPGFTCSLCQSLAGWEALHGN